MCVHGGANFVVVPGIDIVGRVFDSNGGLRLKASCIDSNSSSATNRLYSVVRQCGGEVGEGGEEVNEAS